MSAIEMAAAPANGIFGINRLIAVAVPMTCDMSVHMIDASAMIQRQIFNHGGKKARLICDKSKPVTQPSFVDNACEVR